MKKNVIILFVCIMLTGCNTTPKADITAEAQAIRNLEEQWTAAIQAADAGKAIGFYAVNAVSMSSNKPIAEGIDAISNKIKADYADTTVIFNTYKCMIDAVEVSASGDMAYVRGHDAIMVKTKEGSANQEGKWVDIWKKVDGNWKVIVSIGSSDQPVAGQ